ncbi:MAG TPA: hypothetical protein VIM65_20610 [Cyclobacteriaceae bacterium]
MQQSPNYNVIVYNVQTDGTGRFSINLGEKFYNLLMTPTQITNAGIFARAHEEDLNETTVNQIFELLGQTYGYDIPLSTPGIRLFGLNTFIAKDGAGNILTDAEVRLIVVVYN